VIAAVSGPSIPLAFLAGLVSFLSPCVFPLMPAYAAYLGGRAGRPSLAVAGAPGGTIDAAGSSSVLTTGVAFVLGFSVVFIAEYYLLEGVLAITVFQRNLDLVNRVAGAIIMVLALQTMGLLRFGWLARERRFHLPVSSGASAGRARRGGCCDGTGSPRTLLAELRRPTGRRRVAVPHLAAFGRSRGYGVAPCPPRPASPRRCSPSPRSP